MNYIQRIGSPNVEDLDSDDSKESSNSRQENGSSADSFVSIDEPDERMVGSISTKDILEQKIAMIANVKITSSHGNYINEGTVHTLRNASRGIGSSKV